MFHASIIRKPLILMICWSMSPLLGQTKLDIITQDCSNLERPIFLQATVTDLQQGQENNVGVSFYYDLGPAGKVGHGSSPMQRDSGADYSNLFWVLLPAPALSGLSGSGVQLVYTVQVVQGNTELDDTAVMSIDPGCNYQPVLTEAQASALAKETETYTTDEIRKKRKKRRRTIGIVSGVIAAGALAGAIETSDDADPLPPISGRLSLTPAATGANGLTFDFSNDAILEVGASIPSGNESADVSFPLEFCILSESRPDFEETSITIRFDVDPGLLGGFSLTGAEITQRLQPPAGVILTDNDFRITSTTAASITLTLSLDFISAFRNSELLSCPNTVVLTLAGTAFRPASQ